MGGVRVPGQSGLHRQAPFQTNKNSNTIFIAVIKCFDQKQIVAENAFGFRFLRAGVYDGLGSRQQKAERSHLQPQARITGRNWKWDG